MKSIIKILSVTAVTGSLLFLGGCTKKIDESFANPNAPVRVPIETILPGVQAGMVVFHSANGTLYGIQRDAQHIGKFIQNWATNSTGNRQDMMGDFYGTTAPDNMGDIWAMLYYGHGQNVSRIIQWGTEEKKWDYVGVAYAIRAWGFMTTTDVTDDIIYREAFRPEQLIFKYDPQQDVYEGVIGLCHTALDFLSRTGDSVSQSNLNRGDSYMNGGDVNKWKKFVYAVLAKTYHRYTNKSAQYKPDSVIKYCDLAMQTNAENTNLRWSNAGGAGTYSFYSPFRGNIGTFRQTRFIADLMSGLNGQFPTGTVDPRAPYIIRENPNGTYKGIRPNRGTDGLPTADQPHNFWGGLFSSTTGSDATARYVFRNNPVWPIISAAEMKFVKAEALWRKGDKPGALTAYVQGINLNFDQLISDYEENVPVSRRITPASRAAYLANPFVVPTANNLTLSHIMLQKYIALYGWGVVETWVDMRRYHYNGDPDPVTGYPVYRDFVPPSGSDLFANNFGKLIYRQRPRFNSEYLYNVDELNRLGAFAPDYITKEPWFSKPE
ncbi:MAG TPA: SusD/RagB family nutrient-binding outer membrane lipoprotein [Chitinophagaceae bacterium]|nr:SusD/RagB family nutrient-binding outer membrane lipoprotein [Chitinophagaceae bacterium]